jgi:hypothetical protein
MKILFDGFCFRTNQVLVGRDVSTIEISMSGRTIIQGYLSACISASIFRKFVVRTSGRFSGKSRL